RLKIREYLRHPRARLPVLLEGERTLHERAGIALPDDDVAVTFERHPMIFLERRFVLEGVDMADAAAHEQRNHGLRLRREVRRLRSVRRVHVFWRRAIGLDAGRQQLVSIEQVEERQPADAHAGLHPEFPAGDET